MAICKSIVALAFCSVSYPSLAQMSGGDLYNDCESGNAAKLLSCVSYLNGVWESHLVTIADVNSKARSNPAAVTATPAFCLSSFGAQGGSRPDRPDTRPPSPSEVRQALARIAQAKPQVLGLPRSITAVLAFKDAFPCR
jgi:hypothetical protein